MLEDLREILKDIISIEDLEKAIEYSVNHEEHEEDLPYLKIDKERIYCEFRKDNREVRITIQNIRGAKYYFLCGSTYENGQWVNDEEIVDFEIYLKRFKETLENYIEYREI